MIVMGNAYLLPASGQGSAIGLLYRPPSLTNVFVTDGFGMYDYLVLGKVR
jgi:peptide/nickel transport system substrate-binding protein